MRNYVKCQRPRRSRRRLFGTIIKSAAEQYWTVYWEDINRFSDHSSPQLKIECTTSNFSNESNTVEELSTMPGMHFKPTKNSMNFLTVTIMILYCIIETRILLVATTLHHHQHKLRCCQIHNQIHCKPFRVNWILVVPTYTI
jgi:hypothetical protein